ncbi:MAG: flagellin, partial [SAR324 cluster bacterium]|nr:flagellin [SAR324 cluster bacterium]
MKIKFNPAAQNTLRHYGVNADRVNQSLRNLSSGKTVVDGTDGGASLFVSTNMQNKVTGLKQAQTNTETSMSLLQTAEAAMAEGVDILN